MTNQTPDHLPPVPDGYVYAGSGQELESFAKPIVYRFYAPNSSRGPWLHSKDSTQTSRQWESHVDYAVPDTSDLGRKILAERGKPSWEDLPEWAAYRAQDAKGRWWALGHGSIDAVCVSSGGYTAPSMEHVATGEPSPNWRETLERRPESDDRPLEHKGDVEMVVISRFGDDTPGLIIPESVANQLSDEATGSIIYAARENGYRIDIDECGIRGWKGD